MKTAIVTEKALKKGQIGFAYRAGSREGKDSGWRFLFDDSEDPLDTSNPDKVYICEMDRLKKYFPSLEYLPRKGVFQRMGVQWIEKETVPTNCQLPRKTKMNDGMMGWFLTSDPGDMRQLKKQGLRDWELLLPQEIRSV